MTLFTVTDCRCTGVPKAIFLYFYFLFESQNTKYWINIWWKKNLFTFFSPVKWYLNKTVLHDDVTTKWNSVVITRLANIKWNVQKITITNYINYIVKLSAHTLILKMHQLKCIYLFQYQMCCAARLKLVWMQFHLWMMLRLLYKFVKFACFKPNYVINVIRFLNDKIN